MQEIRQSLAPLTDWIPPEFRSRLPVESWWLIELVAVLFVLVVVGYLLRAILRRLTLLRRVDIDWDLRYRVDLNTCPLANGPAGACVYHVSAHLRLVVVAPGGKGVMVSPQTVLGQLDYTIPGLAALVEQDHPRVIIWPAQLSRMGFTNSFHRCTPTGQTEEDPSQWILLAGRAEGGGQTLFIGLGLWSETPTTLGRMNLETHDWLNVLRLTVGRPA
jgi:hypothetical protein